MIREWRHSFLHQCSLSSAKSTWKSYFELSCAIMDALDYCPCGRRTYTGALYCSVACYNRDVRSHSSPSSSPAEFSKNTAKTLLPPVIHGHGQLIDCATANGPGMSPTAAPSSPPAQHRQQQQQQHQQPRIKSSANNRHRDDLWRWLMTARLAVRAHPPPVVPIVRH